KSKVSVTKMVVDRPDSDEMIDYSVESTSDENQGSMLRIVDCAVVRLTDEVRLRTSLSNTTTTTTTTSDDDDDDDDNSSTSDNTTSNETVTQPSTASSISSFCQNISTHSTSSNLTRILIRPINLTQELNRVIRVNKLSNLSVALTVVKHSTTVTIPTARDSLLSKKFEPILDQDYSETDDYNELQLFKFSYQNIINCSTKPTDPCHCLNNPIIFKFSAITSTHPTRSKTFNLIGHLIHDSHHQSSYTIIPNLSTLKMKTASTTTATFQPPRPIDSQFINPHEQLEFWVDPPVSAEHEPQRGSSVDYLTCGSPPPLPQQAPPTQTLILFASNSTLSPDLLVANPGLPLLPQSPLTITDLTESLIILPSIIPLQQPSESSAQPSTSAGNQSNNQEPTLAQAEWTVKPSLGRCIARHLFLLSRKALKIFDHSPDPAPPPIPSSPLDTSLLPKLRVVTTITSHNQSHLFPSPLPLTDHESLSIVLSSLTASLIGRSVLLTKIRFIHPPPPHLPSYLVTMAL
ncbi:hypothetical protein BY996DRAFT_6509780, partial [Phakopsora pachyrhizi]